MEAEYVALSQAMRDLIPIREILKEIMGTVFRCRANIQYCTHSKAFANVDKPHSIIEQSTVYEDNAACSEVCNHWTTIPPYQAHWYPVPLVSI
jgi:hypothetical protein